MDEQILGVWQRCEAGHCIEIMFDGLGTQVHMRDSVNPSVVLTVSREDWDAFVSKIRAHGSVATVPTS